MLLYWGKKTIVDDETKFERNFITTIQLAKRCGASHFTILNWIKQGKIEANRFRFFGGQYRIPLSEVASLVKTLSQEGSSQD